MTIDLADYFRQTLSLGGRERIQLAQELELVQRYLAIEQRRMGDRLRLCLDIEPACHAAWLPPLLLQPLVENAVKHGIRPLDEGGTIELQARHVGDRLVLRIVNPVDADAPRDTSGLGQGLRHLKTWLQTLYAEPTFVDVERSTHHYTVQISLPWQP
jgi:LytS/YehU family sensor histidine kinase